MGLEFAKSYLKSRDNEKLGKFVLTLMEITKTPITKFQKQNITQHIIRVSGDMFSTLEERKAFAVLIAIESKFSPTAKSSAGATGLSQIIVKFAPEFAGLCGIDNLTNVDLRETEINLILGACQFKRLLSSFDGNIASALVAYNAGSNSKSLKELQSFSNIANPETANYISRFTYLKEVADKHEKDETKAETDNK